MSGFLLTQYWKIGKYKYVFYRFLIECLCRHFKDGWMLDAGCGHRGSSLTKLPEHANFVGLDVNCNNVKSSHKQNPSGHYVLGSVTHLPFREDTFKLCITVDVFEHLQNKNTATTELNRVIAHQGELIGSTTNIMNPVLLFDSYAPTYLKMPLVNRFAGLNHYDRHKRLGLREILKLFNSSNFNVDVYMVGFPPFAAWFYQHGKKKPNVVAYLWTVFNRLSNKLYLLKETFVFHARKV